MKSLSLLCLIPFVTGAPGHFERVAASINKANANAFSFEGSSFGNDEREETVSDRSGKAYNLFQSRSLNVNAYAFPVITNNLRSGDIIASTRTLSNQVQTTLRQLAADPASAVIVNRIINDKDNICINSLEEGIAGIETATKLVERAGNDIKRLITKVNSVKNLRDPATVVRAVADLLLLVEPVVHKLAPETPIICAATPEQAFGSLRSLASLVNELSYTNQLSLSAEGRRQLKDSASTISAVTTFLTQLRSNFVKFSKTCTADKKYNIEAISAIGDLMVNLADMFGTLGGIEQGEQIRKGKAYVNNLVTQLNKIGNLGFGDNDCTRPGDFSYAASTMKDLAVIIDQVGIETLQQQLGIDLSFTLSP